MAEIVASIMARSADEVVRDARQAAMAGADWLELRLDEWRDDPPLSALIPHLGLPVLVTARLPRDGGRYRGSLKARIGLLDRAIEAGAGAIDLEDWERWAPDDAAVRVIRSHHDFKRVPADPVALRDGLFAMGADVVKIVGMAHELADAAPLVELMASSDPLDEPTIAFAMGRTAAATRVLACALGAPWVYGALGSGSETAPGQPTVAELRGYFRVSELGPATAVFGLLGDPALQSLGPALHNRAMRAMAFDGLYLPFETARPRDVIAMLPRRRLRGLSVTAPHKERCVALCHRLTDDAQAVGAVNTLMFEAHGQIVGHNTDIAGVRGALHRAGVIDGDGHGVVIGGGGAARGAAIALQRMGLRVTVLARTLEPMRAFCAERGYRLGALRADVLVEDPPVAVVHATPTGSAGSETAGERVLPEWTPAPGCRVLDMVYTPRMTPLLQHVREHGGVPVPGIEMFLTQAAEQLACFVGHRPAEDELRRYVAGA